MPNFVSVRKCLAYIFSKLFFKFGDVSRGRAITVYPRDPSNIESDLNFFYKILMNASIFRAKISNTDFQALRFSIEHSVPGNVLL